MSEAQFTKGPCTIENGWLYGKDDGYTVEIADIDFNEEENEFHKENKALILSAPDLYEALELAAIFIAECDTIDGEEPFTLTIINKALAKARGEQK